LFWTAALFIVASVLNLIVIFRKPKVSLSSTAPMRDSSPLRIHSAVYGTGPDTDIDVTHKLQEMARDGLVVSVANDLVPRDPHFGVTKRLEVEYSFGNPHRTRISRPEGARLVMPEDTWVRDELERAKRVPAIAQKSSNEKQHAEQKKLEREVLTMPVDEYRHRIETDPDFRRRVDALPLDTKAGFPALIPPQMVSPSVSSADWKDLADRFERIPSPIRAEWQSGGRHFNGTPVGEAWFTAGGQGREECDALCDLGGALLLRSSIAASVPEKALQATENVDRWLFFLKHLGMMEFNPSGTQSYPDGSTEVVLTGTIKGLGVSSKNACIWCAARELR
jgi:hypothetical protein